VTGFQLKKWFLLYQQVNRTVITLEQLPQQQPMPCCEGTCSHTMWKLPHQHSCDVGSAVVLEDLPRLEACLQADFFRPRPCLRLEPFPPRLTSVSHFLPRPWLGLTTSASALLCLAVSALSSAWLYGFCLGSPQSRKQCVGFMCSYCNCICFVYLSLLKIAPARLCQRWML